MEDSTDVSESQEPKRFALLTVDMAEGMDDMDSDVESKLEDWGSTELEPFKIPGRTASSRSSFVTGARLRARRRRLEAAVSWEMGSDTVLPSSTSEFLSHPVRFFRMPSNSSDNAVEDDALGRILELSARSSSNSWERDLGTIHKIINHEEKSSNFPVGVRNKGQKY